MGSSGRSQDRLRLIVERFAGTKVLVIGDVMVDRYFWGTVQRISPEAPVPVVDVAEETRRLGGAANVAHNICTLGGEAMLIGLTGKDAAGEWLLEEMARLGMSSEGIVVSEKAPTTVKSRVVAHNQQVVRFDRETRKSPPAEAKRELERLLKAHWGSVGGAVISDYAKGVVGGGLMDTVRTLNRGRKKIPVAADPKSPRFKKYRGVTVVTPNLHEALAAAGITSADGAAVERAGNKLRLASETEAVLITRGEDGMSLFEKGRSPAHLPTVAREVYDVTGAGDTVVGTLSLALAAGAGMKDAAILANMAAGVVVGEFGTVPATGDQLLAIVS